MQVKNGMFAVAAAALMVNTVCTPTMAAADAAGTRAPSGPSAFVRCDGFPNKASTLGTVARLVAISAVVGLLLPSREATGLFAQAAADYSTYAALLSAIPDARCHGS